MGNPKSKMFSLSVIAFMLVVAGAVAEGQQQPKRVPRIGYLTGATPEGQTARIEAFHQGLRELGYIEGNNIIIEYRYAELKPERRSTLAAELVRLKVDVIVTSGVILTRAAKDATVSIPIVMTQVGDPVGSGLIASLARPGANITGLSNLAPR